MLSKQIRKETYVNRSNFCVKIRAAQLGVTVKITRGLNDLWRVHFALLLCVLELTSVLHINSVHSVQVDAGVKVGEHKNGGRCFRFAKFIFSSENIVAGVFLSCFWDMQHNEPVFVLQLKMFV